MNSEASIPTPHVDGNSSAAVPLGARGTCVDHAMNWDEVAVLVATNRFEKLGRLAADLEHYKQKIREYKEEFATVGDYVLHTKFGCGCKIDAEGKKYVHPDDIVQDERFVWAENDFPYALDKKIQHHLLWSTKPLSKEQLEQIIPQHISTDWEYIYFVNPPTLQTVHNVYHAHILSRRRGD